MPNDLLLDTNGDLDMTTGLLTLVEGVDAIAQHIRTRLRLFVGEWFLDTRAGTPYYEIILVKNPDMTAIAAALRKVIGETPGVISIVSYAQTVNRTTRALTVTFTVMVEDGPLTLAETIALYGSAIYDESVYL